VRGMRRGGGQEEAGRRMFFESTGVAGGIGTPRGFVAQVGGRVRAMEKSRGRGQKMRGAGDGIKWGPEWM
jgi:hypothetical protein